MELFNLDEDIGETHNLAAKNPETVEALTMLLSERLRQ